MNAQDLIDTARMLVADYKGLLAMDESNPTTTSSLLLLIVILGVGGVLASILSSAIKVANEWERLVVLRLGKFLALKGAGLVFIIPIIDTIPYRIDTRVITASFQAEKTLTKDTVPVDVDAVLFWKVIDPQKAALDVADYKSAISWVSQTAVHDGKPVDTSMSFTPTAGLPMSTRSGDLDPGLVWYLARTEQMSAKQFNEMVNFQSGLLGISETSSDMRDLLDREMQDERAAIAIALFCYQVKKWIGAFAAALGGVDRLVFAGGIGENAPTVRARICDGLGFLGIELEAKRNAANEDVISAVTSRVPVRVIHTDEALMIARLVCHTLKFG
ncbi:MAG: SPFH domain-containing protein [Nostoc sp.]|uniref:SPFH domain-containing protein n=1 Tax=Nostoc sp. TaxID=1180 RepID=UPI002FF7F59A